MTTTYYKAVRPDGTSLAAAIATLARDLITDEHYQVLMAPWLEVVA